MSSIRRYSLPRRARLSGRRAFEHVYQARTNSRAWPLTVWARPNGLDVARLGMTVSRRVGGAVTRNRIKRLLRDSFRLMQHDEVPPGYDLIIGVQPHEPLTLAQYRQLLARALGGLHRRCQGEEATKRPSDQGERP